MVPAIEVMRLDLDAIFKKFFADVVGQRRTPALLCGVSIDDVVQLKLKKKVPKTGSGGQQRIIFTH